MNNKSGSEQFQRGYKAGFELQKKFVADLQKRRNELIVENEKLKDRLFYLEAYFDTSHKNVESASTRLETDGC